MKRRIIIVLLLTAYNGTTFSQLESFGLDSLIATDLRFYGNTLYAGTDGDGVFSRDMSDIAWISLGLEGKNIRTVYPHQVGPLGFAVTVGVKPERITGDSTLVYCWFNQAWNITDTGMDHSNTFEIRSIDGIPTQQVCGETFAGGSGKVFRKKTNFWEMVFEGVVINVVRVSPKYEIWIGGETNIFWPFLAKSTDIGDTWTMMYPDLAGDNACNSIAFDPSDSNIVYAGMEGVVIKTTDGGVSWSRTGLTGTPFYMRGVAVDPIEPSHLFAGGIAVPDSFGLFESTDAGESWQNIKPTNGTKGVSSIIFNPTDNSELFVATYGSGVFLYKSPVVSVSNEIGTQKNFALYQNYPNPFNPATTIHYEIPKASHVILKVFNILGQTVITLLDEKMDPGLYDVKYDASALSSGVYYYRLQADDFVQTKKFILIK